MGKHLVTNKFPVCLAWKSLLGTCYSHCFSTAFSEIFTTYEVKDNFIYLFLIE